MQEADTKQIHHTDETIQDDIWRALWNEETIRTMDIHDISVDVENRHVCLSGYLSQDLNKKRIEEITCSVPGVVAVHNHLVTDDSLVIQVAQALGNDERTRPFTVPVYCYHGWIELGGRVPNCDTQRAAEETAANVQEVRGVVLLPEIEHDHNPSLRNPVQPGVGLRVYGGDEIEGLVYQVVINPRNRLVTHAIVRVDQMIEGRQETCSYLVPIEDMHIVDEGGILLNCSAPSINKYPVFDPADYPFAPLTWQPPYPYAAGTVRWSRQEKP